MILPTFSFLDRLHFCTRCGGSVPAYAPSQIGLNDMYEYGLEPEGLESELYYFCSQCNREWLATNLMDTGSGCPACTAFMPMTNAHCGGCGAKLRR